MFLVALLYKITNNLVIPLIILFSVLILASGQLYIGMVNHPYRISQPLTKLDKKLDEQGVYVDEKTYNYVTQVEIFLKDVDLEDNHPMLDINTLPGIVYLLKGKSPGILWSRSNISPWRIKRLVSSSMKGIEKTILFLPSSGISKNYESVLNKKGILYPQNYTEMGRLAHPVHGYNVSVLVPNILLP